LGAAIVGGLIAGDRSVADLVVVDVAPFTMGIEINKRIGMQERTGYFLPIINRNSTIPISRVERVQTTRANQTSVRVAVYQGESRRVEQNHALGEFSVDGVPPGPAGQEVDIRFTYDLNGVLEVEATIVSTGRRVQHLITQHARGLTDKEVTRAVAAMQELKSHPREEAANRLLLHRAERLYQELPQMERQMLSELLDGFESALEAGEKTQIDEFREGLRQFLDRFDPPADDSSGQPDE
jgi:molecular chaperone HscC